MDTNILKNVVKMEVQNELFKMGLSSKPVKVKVKKFNEDVELDLPQYETIGSSAMDVKSTDTQSVLEPGCTVGIGTNISVEIPVGYEIQVRPRSGLAFKNGITVLNSPGTIDSDYRGEIKVILHNAGAMGITINPGDRIAQLVLAKVQIIEWHESGELSNTKRGVGGFGSTGINDASPVGLPKPILETKN